MSFHTNLAPGGLCGGQRNMRFMTKSFLLCDLLRSNLQKYWDQWTRSDYDQWTQSHYVDHTFVEVFYFKGRSNTRLLSPVKTCPLGRLIERECYFYGVYIIGPRPFIARTVQHVQLHVDHNTGSLLCFMTSSMAQTTGSCLHVGHGNRLFLPQQMWECSCRHCSMLQKCLLPVTQVQVWTRVEVGLSGRSRTGVVTRWATFGAFLLQLTLNAVIINYIIKGGFLC